MLRRKGRVWYGWDLVHIKAFKHIPYESNVFTDGVDPPAAGVSQRTEVVVIPTRSIHS